MTDIAGRLESFGPGFSNKEIQLYCALFGAVAIISSSFALNLLATSTNKAYETSLVIALCLWIGFVVVRLDKVLVTRRRGNILALVFVTTYALSNFILARYSISHFIRVKGDLGVFVQSLWWTLRGTPLFNTMDGTSHLGVHSSFALLLIAPLYAIWKSPVLLTLIQAVALASSGFLLFRITRRRLDDLSALLLLLVFLLSPGLQYGFGDFYESSLATPLVVLSIYGALEKRWVIMVVSSVLLITVKETFPLMIVFLGLYLIKSKSWRAGIATSLAGVVAFFFAMRIVIPWFRTKYAIFPTDFEHLSPYSRFGTSLGQVVINALTNPSLTLSAILEAGKVGYLVSILAPYLLVGIAGSLLWIVALPELAITLLSNHANNAGPLLAGGRFSTVTVVALALACVISLRKAGVRFGARATFFHRCVASTFFFVTMALVPLWLNSTCFAPVAGAAEMPTLIQQIGAVDPVAVPYDVAASFAQRAVVFDINRNPPEVIASCSKFVVMRHNRPELIYSAIQAKQFRQVWNGEVFELWQSEQKAACDLPNKPW
jgi:uncharacterized membrane protein